MNTQEVILQLLLGGLLGTVGQGLRIIVGMKKLNDEANSLRTKLGILVDTSRILISLLIGFCAGVLAVLATSDLSSGFFSGENLKERLLAIIAAGYAGTDFIEGMMKKYLPGTDTATRKPDSSTTREGNKPN